MVSAAPLQLRQGQAATPAVITSSSGANSGHAATGGNLVIELSKSAAMQVIFEYLPMRQVVQLQIVNKKCYKIVGYCVKSMKFVDYDSTVKDRLSCGTRVLLLGAESQVFHICSLATNYSQK